MEIDENLKYTFLQFDPCPRAGEPMVSRRKFCLPFSRGIMTLTDFRPVRYSGLFLVEVLLVALSGT